MKKFTTAITALVLSCVLGSTALAAGPVYDTCQGDPFCERVGPDSVPYDPGICGDGSC